MIIGINPFPMLIPSRISQEQRRAYWTEQLERAHDFMHRALSYPVQECGEPMVALEPAAREFSGFYLVELLRSRLGALGAKATTGC